MQMNSRVVQNVLLRRIRRGLDDGGLPHGRHLLLLGLAIVLELRVGGGRVPRALAMCEQLLSLLLLLLDLLSQGCKRGGRLSRRGLVIGRSATGSVVKNSLDDIGGVGYASSCRSTRQVNSTLRGLQEIRV